MFIIPSGVFANVYILSKDIYKVCEKNKYRINTTQSRWERQKYVLLENALII